MACTIGLLSRPPTIDLARVDQRPRPRLSARAPQSAELTHPHSVNSACTIDQHALRDVLALNAEVGSLDRVGIVGIELPAITDGRQRVHCPPGEVVHLPPEPSSRELACPKSVERDEEDLVRLYLTDIGQYPLLTKDDEVRLAQAIEDGNEARTNLDKGGKS